MRAVALLLAALSLLGLASAFYRKVPHKPVDKNFLLTQGRLYQLLWHLGQPSLHDELREIASSYQLEKHIDHFKNPEVVERFIKYYRRGYFQQRGERFSILDKKGQLQVKLLLDLLYNALDFETVFKTAVWAREYLNEVMFVQAFAIQFLLRNEPNFVIPPAPYDVIPQRYVNPVIIQQAWRAALEGKCFDKKHPYVIRVNYSSCDNSRADSLLSYFTQDVSLLAYRDLYRGRYAFGVKFEEYNQPKYIRRGDDFYYFLKIILNRYYLERLSHHLPDIEPIDYKEPVCGVKSYNSLVQDLITIERRLKDAIESGCAYDCDGKKYSLRDPLSSDIFGNIVEGNADSIHREYYGSIYYRLLEYAQQLIDSCENYMVGSFFLNSQDSVFRSPLYYRVVKRVVQIMDHFKDRLGPYSHKQLWLPGVKVLSLDVDNLVTYMEDFDFELNNVIPVPNIDKAANLMVVARQRRLNHKPFSYRVTVYSDREIEVLVRFFIGPQHDVYGKQLSLNEKRQYMIYTDSFFCKLEKGKNELVRNSTQFHFYAKLSLSYDKLYQLTKSGLAGEVHPFLDDFVYKAGYTDHLIIPRGRRSGLRLSTYVILTPAYHKDRSWINPSDGFSLFPFDRPIKEAEFAVPNARFSTTTVYHRDYYRPITEEVTAVPNAWSSGATDYQWDSDRPIIEAVTAVPNAWSSGATDYQWDSDRPIKEAKFAVPNAWSSGASDHHWDDNRPIKEAKFAVPNAWSSGTSDHPWDDNRPIKEAKFAVPNTWSSGVSDQPWDDNRPIKEAKFAVPNTWSSGDSDHHWDDGKVAAY